MTSEVRRGDARYHAPMNATISLRALFLLVLVVALFCGMKAYEIAFFIGFVVVLHFLLLHLGSQVARFFPRTRSPLERRRFVISSNADIIVAWRVLPALCYLVIFLAWQLLLTAALKPIAVGQEWFMPTPMGISLHVIHTMTLIALNLYLFVGYLGDCYGSGRLSVPASILTATACSLVALAHFAAPLY